MYFKHFKWGLLWSLFILIICLMPGNNLPKSTFLEDLYIDKIIHVFLYLVLFFLVQKGANKLTKNPFFTAAIYCLLYGIMIEFLQHFLVLGRQGDVNDIYANFLGIVIGIVLLKRKKSDQTIEPLDNLSL